jgi:hypothetical protein
MAIGTSYNLFIKDKFAIEFGVEFDFNLNSDFDNIGFIYPLFFVGGKFSTGPLGK